MDRRNHGVSALRASPRGAVPGLPRGSLEKPQCRRTTQLPHQDPRPRPPGLGPRTWTYGGPPIPTDHPDPSTPTGAPQPQDPGPRPSPIREALLGRFQDPEDAAAVRCLGTLLLDLVNESGRFALDEEENQVWPALLAVARNLLLEASNQTENADQYRWNRELPEEEGQLAARIEVRAVQVQLLAGSTFFPCGRTSAIEASTSRLRPGGSPSEQDARPISAGQVE